MPRFLAENGVVLEVHRIVVSQVITTTCLAEKGAQSEYYGKAMLFHVKQLQIWFTIDSL